MIITHTLTMDLANHKMLPPLDAMQDDRYSRNVSLILQENGKAWPIPADSRVFIAYRKPDGTAGHYDTLPDGTSAWNSEGNTLTLALAPQVLTAAGLVIASVQLAVEDQTISTFSFAINVHRNPASEIFESEDYIHLQQWFEPVLKMKLDVCGWEPGRFLVTDDEGCVRAMHSVEVVPFVTAEDNGKFLRVVKGRWAAERLGNAEEVPY